MNDTHRQFHHERALCTGCHTCAVACKDWKDIPAGPVNLRRVTSIERGTYPNVSVIHDSVSCNHCVNAACVPACPAGAIHQRPSDGVVVVDRDACIGASACGKMCYAVCPYGAPQFGPEANPRMQLCDLCLDRLQAGKQPVCVDACPLRVLSLASVPQEFPFPGRGGAAPMPNRCPGHARGAGPVQTERRADDQLIDK
ncbi:MAG: 4Fe-4S dicluster domain-containing protein [Chloroflexi bacterium]|nr:4Fe-4S dicluster domain-containing protein [Chloroflexota bacterium]